MGKIVRNTPTVGNPDFDWSMYEDGWNGSSVKINTSVKTGNKKAKVYSHEAYASSVINKYMGQVEPMSKELRKDTLVSISGLNISNNTVLATINGGANNVVIDLNKEQKFFNTISLGDEKMTKETFIACIQDPEARARLLEMGLVAKIGTDVEKASIWDGYVENLSAEMREQITKNNKAYMATVISSNNGGFVVEVADTIKAFMPGSMAAANKLNDYESLVGTTMEVMVESYDKKLGFVVSRKKYLRTITPIHLKVIGESIKANADTVFAGKVTGTTPFGVFVELEGYDGCLTGMIHKTLMGDDMRAALRINNIPAGTELNVYVHKIEKGRLIFSNVPSAEREAVIAKREAEDAQEKSDYVSAKNEAPKIDASKIASTDASINIAVEA